MSDRGIGSDEDFGPSFTVLGIVAGGRRSITRERIEKMGRQARFHTTDSGLRTRSGQTVDVLGPPPPDAYEVEETGPMFRVRFADGFETDAFEDELTSPERG